MTIKHSSCVTCSAPIYLYIVCLLLCLSSPPQRKKHLIPFLCPSPLLHRVLLFCSHTLSSAAILAFLVLTWPSPLPSSPHFFYPSSLNCTSTSDDEISSLPLARNYVLCWRDRPNALKTTQLKVINPIGGTKENRKFKKLWWNSPFQATLFFQVLATWDPSKSLEEEEI